jgi:hypothetical protein
MAKKATKKAKAPAESKKKAAPKPKVVKEVKPVIEMAVVLRFNPKDGERYKMEIPVSEILYEQNGDAGLKDIIV